ncbi:MAG: hypothetical protein PHE55_03855 [Methylococcaceae bacterium]|nr:hypothetical protein [Methylococcaceae bacterium]
MFNLLTFQRTLLTAVLFVCALPASASFFDFDSVPADAQANHAIGAAYPEYSFAYAAFLPRQDSFGIDIPGSERWVADPSITDPVLVANPLSYNVGGDYYGAAPSGRNALDANSGPILLQFSTPQVLESFSTQLAAGILGTILNSSAHLKFLDSTGGELLDYTFNQIALSTAASGLILNVGPVNGLVSSVLLPQGAFYDNIAVVPEPPVAALFGFGLFLIRLLRVRQS